MKKEFNVIADLLPNNTRVLDVGCGDGSLMNLLKEEKDNLENEFSQITNDNACFLYYSVFYGDLTKNWIKLKH